MPHTIGGYEIRQTRGQGAAATVYEAFNPRLRRRVALKVMDLTGPADAMRGHLLTRFRQEARITAGLHHPGLVAVFDFDETPEYAFLAMEYIDGETLKEMLARTGPLPVPRALEIITEVLRTLAYCHQNGVIHRDIKPSNLLLPAIGGVKLADFGIARPDAQSDGTLIGTELGMMLGTPSYMSPEQFTALAPVDARSDLWSCAVVLCELLTGKRPFQGDDPITLAYRVVHAAPALPSSLLAGIPTALDTVLARALAKQPQDRSATADDFAVALRDAVRLVATPAPPPVPAPELPSAVSPSVAPPPPAVITPLARTSMRLLLVLSAIMLALAAGIGVAAWQNYQRQQAELAQRAHHAEEAARQEADRQEAARQEALRQTTLAAATPGNVFRDCASCPELVVVPGGQFTMGSPAGEVARDSDEGPQRVVRVASFAAGKFEVTFAEWDACVAGGGCNGYRPSDNGWGRGRQPVINVSWDDAQAYAAWLSGTTGKRYRLLTEAEWEYVCRSGTATAFSFGPTISTTQANYDGNFTYGAGQKEEFRGRTVPVGSLPVNGFGLHEMHGNVFEWVEDAYRASYTGAPTDGSAVPGDAAAPRVLRGGSWFNLPRVLRCAYHFGDTPGIRSVDVGFRVARAL